MNIKVDRADIEEIGRTLSGIKNAVPLVVSRAINRTLTNVQTDAVKRIGAKINLKAARIRSDFSLFKASVNSPKGSILATGRPVPFIDFIGTKPLASGGVSVKVYRDGQRIKFRHLFIATMRSGHVGVFERKHYMGRQWRKSFPYGILPDIYRLPIKEKFGPRIEDTYSRPEIIGPVTEYAGERLVVNIDQQLSYELSKLQ